MRFSKMRDVKSPIRSTAGAAGIDFFVPNDFHDGKSVLIYPGMDILIPSGIKAEIPAGAMLMAADKSGVVTSSTACRLAGRCPKPEAFSSSIIIGAKIVDSDYQGEIHIHLINVGNRPVTISPGMKIAQFILVPVLYCGIAEVPESELFSDMSARGAGGFGSTGTY